MGAISLAQYQKSKENAKIKNEKDDRIFTGGVESREVLPGGSVNIIRAAAEKPCRCIMS